MGKIGVLLVNLGTPDSPSNSDVYKYLIEFLTDKRVMDFGWLKRNLLVRGIIVPARYKHSAKTYRAIWDKDRGSPLLFHTEDLGKKVQSILGDKYVVEIAMRYQNPSIESALKKLQAQLVSEIIVLPLFPQYSSACNGSIIQKVQETTNKWLTLPKLTYINHFYDNKLFIDAIVENARQFNLNDYDHIIFSYHGLPLRHLLNGDITSLYCKADKTCCNTITEVNQNCYRTQCFQTTKLVAEQLGLSSDKYTNTFQSRLGKEIWIEPYSVDVIPALAKQGKRKLLVFSPAFVADCLETLFEISVEYQELFEEHGGNTVQLVPSLNSNATWVNAVADIVIRNQSEK